MRRMRDLTIRHYVAAAVPVLATGFGIYYYTRHYHPSNKSKDTAAIAKSAEPGQESSHKGNRKIALAKDHERIRNAGTSEERDVTDFDKDKALIKDRGNSSKSAPRDSRKPSSEKVTAEKLVAEKLVAEKLVAEKLAAEKLAAEKLAAEKPTSESPSLRKLTPEQEAAANDAAAIGTECATIEYRGVGPRATKVTKGDWTAVMDQFHGAKRSLLNLVDKRRHDLSEATAKALENQIRNLKIQRPPASDEPDLAWRGIGVYAQNSEGEPIVKMGGGFVHLVTKHPARARFEMARLVAQSMAPCELKRIGANEDTWAPLLKCLGLSESQACGQGTFSEGGWAVSTTVAAAVSSPGCQIPAFKEPEMAGCLSTLPLNKTVVKAGDKPARDLASLKTGPMGPLATGAYEGVVQ